VSEFLLHDRWEETKYLRAIVRDEGKGPWVEIAIGYEWCSAVVFDLMPREIRHLRDWLSNLPEEVTGDD
jgi:hypothetical protein